MTDFVADLSVQAFYTVEFRIKIAFMSRQFQSSQMSRRLPSITSLGILLIGTLTVVACGRHRTAVAERLDPAIPQQSWRLGYVNSDFLSAASFPFSYYTHVVLLGLNCDGKGALYNQWGYNTANWREYRQRATSQRVNLMLLIGGDMTSCTTANTEARYIKEILAAADGKNKILNKSGIAFEGVALDWEDGLTDAGVPRYEHLIAALRSALGPKRLLTVNGWTADVFKKIVVNQQNNIDRFNNEMYDSAVNGAVSRLHQQWSWYNMANKNVDSGENSGSAQGGFSFYVAAGVPPQKINEGIPFYGYLYSGCTHSEVLGCTAAKRQYHYSEIRNSSSWWAGGQHLTDGRNDADYIALPQSNQYLTYTDTTQIRKLVDWGRSVHLGGYFTWEVDFEGVKGSTLAERFPLSFTLSSSVCSASSFSSSCLRTSR